MIINKNIAEEIISQLKDVIPQDLNFFNKMGIILYSTNKDRINTYHEAAKISASKKSLIRVTRDSEYEGAKKGINIPLFFEDEIIGVIGITGEVLEVEKYATIIKKMTEILLKDQYMERSRNRKRESVRFYINDLKNGKLNDASIQYLGNDSLKQLAVYKTEDLRFNFDDIENIYSSIEKYLPNKNSIYAVSSSEIIIVFNETKMVRQSIEKIVRNIEKLSNLKLSFGISESFRSLSSFKNQYDNSLIALDWIRLRNKEYDLVFYDKMSLGILFSGLSKERKEKYIDRIFKDIEVEEKEMIYDTLSTYIKYNGSITKCSEHLFLHKNTFQYRLNKIKDITGLDPRNLEDFMKLYFASILSR